MRFARRDDNFSVLVYFFCSIIFFFHNECCHVLGCIWSSKVNGYHVPCYTLAWTCVILTYMYVYGVWIKIHVRVVYFL